MLLVMTAHMNASSGESADRLSVDWEGDAFQHHSLALVNRALCEKLLGLGVDLALRAPDAPRVAVSGMGGDSLWRATRVPARAAAVTVRHSWPPRFAPRPAGAWAHVQPWEYGGVPNAWIRALRTVDELWAYSNWVRDNYVASGFPRAQTHVVPCGVDTSVFRPEGDRLSLSLSRSFRFLFVGGLIPRKGIDVLLKAYRLAFSAGDDICLVIKGFGADGTYAGGLHDQVRQLASQPGGPAIELIEDDLTQAQMAGLYRSCDVLVHPYRGEGFALPVMEAMASGLPVVVTADGATSDFCDSSSAWLLPSRRAAVAVPARLGPSWAGYWVAEPDGDHLVGLLRQLPGQARASAAKASVALATARARYDWAVVAETVLARLEALGSARPPAARQKPAPSGGSLSRRAGASGAPKRRARPERPLLSACLIVKDEEKALPRCLASLDRLVDEVVVYDTGSTDATVALARRAGARVVQGYWDDDFGRARNACLEHCLGEWILWVDADEQLVCPDPRGLRGALASAHDVDGLLTEIYNLSGDGTEPGSLHAAVRLFRKATCCWHGKLHEQVDLRAAAGGRRLRLAGLEDARIDHFGYLDEVLQERDKLARNLRLAQAELAAGSPNAGQEGIALLNVGRALAAMRRYSDAQPYFERAEALALPGTPRRAVLLYGTQNLISLGRWPDAVEMARRFRQACAQTGLADYLEAVALRRCGRAEEALELLGGPGPATNEDGFTFSASLVLAEKAGALLEAGRNEEAAGHLAELVKVSPTPQYVAVALKTFALAGRPLEELAEALPEDRLDNITAALLLVAPGLAGAVAEALYRRLGPRPEILAAAIRFAPGLPTPAALDWAARLRATGMGGQCPLLARGNDRDLTPVERVRAAVAAYAAFGDGKGAGLALQVAPAVPDAELASVLAEVDLLAPGLVEEFASAAAGPPSDGPADSTETGGLADPGRRRSEVALALARLGRNQHSAQYQNDAPQRATQPGPAAQLAGSAADR